MASYRLLFILAAALAARPAAAAGPDGFVPYAEERSRMVEEQIEARGVKDARVLAAIREVPRHEFVTEEYWEDAHGDHPLPIGGRQTISQPYIVAYMTELLELRPGDRVLEIGTGSGYQAAVLAKITPKVFSMEILCSLERTARATLDRLGFGNVRTRCADGYKGWPEEAPFDAIILTAAPPRVPRPLLDQLAEGGRLVAPVGNRSQDLVRIRKVKGKLKEEKLLPVIFVPMTGEARKKTPAAGVAPERKPDVDFVPTPHKVVREMLRLARVTAADTVYDLGCGDGRILITAAGTVGARGRGFEIDHFMAEEARLNAEKAKVGHLVTIEERDIFTVDLSSASVVALYLLPEINVKLLPQLSRLRPGARVVSHDFGIEGYPPDAELTVPQYDGKVSKVYLWTAPLRRTTDYFAKD